MLGVEMFDVVPSDVDAYSKVGAMQTVGGAAVVADDDDAAALAVVEVVVPGAGVGYAYAAVLVDDSGVAGSSRY